jgi:hypothetical protein
VQPMQGEATEQRVPPFWYTSSRPLPVTMNSHSSR